MKLEQQVCSLELAKRLKELGVKQESLFYWVDLNFGGKRGDLKPYPMFYQNQRPWDDGDLYSEYWLASAFTAAELGLLLPGTITRQEHFVEPYDLTCQRLGEGWYVFYQTVHDFAVLNGDEGMRNAQSEADARAELLIYLIENKLITLP